MRLLIQENSGVSVARNYGARETTAPLIAFLDADDLWLPGKLARQVEAMRKGSEAVACYTGFHVVNEAGERVAEVPVDGVAGYPAMLAGKAIAMSSVMVRRDPFVRVGGFDPFYSILADFELWLRLAMVGEFLCVPEDLVAYRMSPHGLAQMSGDPVAAYRELMSVYGRHELRAIRIGDRALLAAAQRGRKRSVEVRAQQAAARFADSVVAGSPEWRMLAAAARINAWAGLAGVARRLASGCGGA